MCGIVGLIAKQATGLPYYADDLFTEMLRIDTIRGPDSTGVFGVDKLGRVDLLKGDADGYTFTQSKNYEKFEKQIYQQYQFVIGHNRKATKGSVSAKNAHPFKEANIVLVHNGTITNSKDLNHEVEVDSQAIATALAEHDAVKALGKIDGAFALVWYDMKTKTLNLARNNERPLALIEYDNCWVISSEGGLAHWLQSRESRKAIKGVMVPTEKILTFQLSDLTKAPEEVPYEEFKEWKPTYTAPKTYTTYPPASATHSSNLPVFGNHMNQIALQNKIKDMGFKNGDTIKFQVFNYDDKPVNEQKLLGNPIIAGVLNDEIVVQAHISPPETVEGVLAKSEVFNGTLIQPRPIMGRIVWFVKNIVPVQTVQDIAGRDLDLSEATSILKEGCQRCKGTVDLGDLSKSIVQRKQDGRWRILCKDCLAIAFKEAEERKAKEKEAQPSVH